MFLCFLKTYLSVISNIVFFADQFASLCHVKADLSKLTNSAEPKIGPNGQTYWTVVFNIEIHFGLTEFKARIKWVEDVSALRQMLAWEFFLTHVFSCSWYNFSEQDLLVSIANT